MDDYFYPYPSYNGNDEFPGRRFLGQITNYPEENCHAMTGAEKPSTIFVETLYKEIKKTKKEVRLGISPFGIWRPNYPDVNQRLRSI